MSSRIGSFIALLALAAAPLLAQTPAGQGTISGFVLDGQTGRPIAGVTITLDGNEAIATRSDADGRFTLSVAAGLHSLQFRNDTHAPVALDNVAVTAGQDAEASALMSSKSAVTSVDVVERVDAVAATAEATLVERKLSAVVSDSISRQELSESAAGDAAGALEKVTGVSVVGEGFVYVRGLGERYSATQLNGAMIPTTEPEKRVVPLDLFPAGMIENISILKTYSPDLPAEFSGGMVQLKTIDFPAQRMLSVSMKGGYNSATTFSPFLDYPGAGSDFFGFGGGSRGIPSAIPDNQRLFQGGAFSQQDLQRFGRSFSNNWEPTGVLSQRPAVDWSVVGGGTFGRIGLVGAYTFSNRPQYQREMQRYIRQGIGDPIIFTDYPNYNEYTQTARTGAVLNAALRITSGNKLVFRNTLTQDADKTARSFTGYDGGLDATISSQRLRYIERRLFSTGVEGSHSLGWRNSIARWQFTYSDSNRNEPDLREVFRTVEPSGAASFSAIGSSAIRFFSNLGDKIYEPQADWSMPFYRGSFSGMFKTGFRMTARRRDFQARRFRFIPQQLSTLNLLQPSNQLLAPGNIRPDGFQITEFTRGTDTYDAQMDVYAGFAMVDLAVGPRWRFVGGFRIEDSQQTVTTIDNLVPNSVPVVARLANRDPIPSVNAIYALTARQNLRASYSRTLSRPDFRELSPFDFNNTLGGFVTQGNPNLRRTAISNYDVRWEYFPGGNQVVAASFFVKSFVDPIETTILPTTEYRQTFINAKGARNLGVELEFRQSLARWTPKLREFGLGANVTMVDSNITIRPEDALILTSSSRPLVGQSRYIVNASVQWARPQWRSDARFSANRVGRRITDVGAFSVPDIYQEANLLLDFVYNFSLNENGKWRLRVEGENLGNNNYQWTQGPFQQRQYRLGRTFQVGVTYSFF